MSKLHDFRKNVMAIFPKYTRRKKYYRVFVYRKSVHSLLQVLTRNFSAPKFCMFTTSCFGTSQEANTAVMVTRLQEVSQSTCKVFTLRKD